MSLSPAFKALDMTFRLCLLSFLLLLIFSSREWSFKRLNRVPTFGNNPLIKAYIFGDKRQLSRKVKVIHKDLNLQHLMTPSGLHLASLLLVFTFFFKGKNKRFLLLLLLGALSLPYDGIDSLKRMILFGLIRTNPFFPIGLLHAFLGTFILTFIGGQYFENPLSFTLSFIFLSILLTGKNKLKIFLLILFIQALISDWFGKEFFPLGGLFGLGLSLCSTFLFPLLILESLFSWLPISLPVSKGWLFLLKELHQLKGLPLSLPFLSFVPILLFSYRKKLSYIALIFGLLFIHRPINPITKRIVFTSPPPRGAESIGRVKNGVRLKYENGMRCYSRLKGDQWSTHCYK